MNTFLDPTMADEEKKKAMQKAYEAAPEKWRHDAQRAIFVLSYYLPRITSDDIWRILYKPPEGRALGPVMGGMAKLGYIRKTGETKKTAQVSRHNTDVNVWSSLVFGKAPPPDWHAYLVSWGEVLRGVHPGPIP